MWLTMAGAPTGLSDTARFLIAAGMGLLFSLACLGAALGPDSSGCERLRALDCPARL